MYEINPIHKIYFGYYCNGNDCKVLLGISKKKEVIQNYLENHRGLSYVNYEIEKEEISDNEIIGKYSDYVISEYMGYYIPEIDQMIISLNSPDIDILIDSTISNLNRLYEVVSNVKKIPRHDSSLLIATCKLLISFKKKSILNKIKKSNDKDSPILFCNIKEYLYSVKIFKEQREMNSLYRDYMMED